MRAATVANAEVGVPVLGIFVLDTQKNPFKHAPTVLRYKHHVKPHLGWSVGVGVRRGQLGSLVGEAVGAGGSRGQLGTGVGRCEGSRVKKTVGAAVKSGQVGTGVRKGSVGGPVGVVVWTGSVGAIESNGVGVTVVGARLG